MATIDIELYYDLDRRRWTTSAGGLAAQPSLFIGQSNTIDFKVRFVQGGVPIELTSPSWIAGIKVTDDPLGDYLLLTTTGTKTGTGTATIYTFTLNIDSVELQAYLVGITPSTNSTAFEVRDTVNNIATLPAITCSILPDYTLTGATPAAGSGTLVVDSGATFTVHKSFAMPTTDGTNNYVLKTNGAGVGSWGVALLAEAQTLSAAQITQALANQGITRVSLSAPVTRTSTTTPTNTGLENLNVSLLPSSRYRVTYRLYAQGNNGIQISLTHPSTLVRMDGEFRQYDFNSYSNSFIYADWYTNVGASGTVFYDSGGSPTTASIVIILDITTGSTANTYGTIGLLAAQSFSNATATSISQNTCVEVLKFS